MFAQGFGPLDKDVHPSAGGMLEISRQAVMLGSFNEVFRVWKLFLQ
jgi:hypothetical protein